MIKKVDGVFCFTRGKHQNEKLEDVAVSDPSYLKWVFNEASESLSDEAFHALEDVMEENGIDT